MKINKKINELKENEERKIEINEMKQRIYMIKKRYEDNII